MRASLQACIVLNSETKDHISNLVVSDMLCCMYEIVMMKYDCLSNTI